MKKSLFSIAIIGALILAGCSFNATIEDRVSKILGEMYSVEETYRESQKELKILEEEEQKLFNATMELTQEEQAALEENVGRLQEIVKERTEKLEEEQAAMKQAKEMSAEFDRIEGGLDTHEQQGIDQLKEAVIDRYEAHALFVSEYEQLTTMQKDLYTMLVEKESDFKKLNEQVGAINEQNEMVVAAIERFNEQTIVVNQSREAFYEKLKEHDE